MFYLTQVLIRDQVSDVHSLVKTSISKVVLKWAVTILGMIKNRLDEFTTRQHHKYVPTYTTGIAL